MARPRNGHNGGGRDLPQHWMSGWFDPELEDLFSGQPELKRTATMLRASRPEQPPDPHFRNRLRAQLMAEAARSRSRPRRWFWQISPSVLAWAGAGVGAVAVAATVLTLVNGPPADHQTLVALSNVSAQHSVSPDDVITVSFNQPMDQQAVVSGLHITPATQVQTHWRGNDLVITPLHHLTANTPYTVTINRHSARTASGAVAPSAIQITFGTAPAPPRTASAPPSLATATLGAADSAATVLFAPDGSVVVTNAPAPPALSVASSGTAPASAAATNLPTPAAAPPTPVMLLYPADGRRPQPVGPAATLAAFSPNGGLLAAVVADSSGGARLIVSSATGAHPVTLASSSDGISSIAWTSNRQLVLATADGVIRSVDLSAVSHTLAEPASVGGVQLSPEGSHAYLAPQSGSGGELLDIKSGDRTPVPGAGRSVAFSGDGEVIAWLDSSQTPARVQTQIIATGARAAVALQDASATVQSIVLNRTGSEIAYVQRPGSGRSSLVLAQLPSGSQLAVGPAASSFAFSADGGAVALLNSTTPAPSVQRALIPGSTQPAQSAGLPVAARTALQAFIDAQVALNRDALASLSTATSQAADTTPAGLSRGYLVSAAANPDGSISATAELIVDPTSSHPQARTADETMTLTPGPDGAFLVSALAVSPLRDELAGPHVVGVTTAAQPNGAVLQISFDSDLNRDSVARAISLVTAAGDVLPATITYNAETRSATVTLATVPASPITVNIDATLRDVDGQYLASSFSTRAGF